MSSASGLDPGHLLQHVVKPTLLFLELPGGLAAERLVMGTAAQESGGFRYLHQLGRGPALGLFQMEPSTFADLWHRARRSHTEFFKSKLEPLAAALPALPEQLMTNLALAAAMCRWHYYLRPFRLDPEASVETLASWWKRHYNTPAGAGTEAEFRANYRSFVAPLFGGR